MSGSHTTIAHIEYGLDIDTVVDLRRPPINKPEVSKHHHVVIKMPDGGEMWLDIDSSDNCTDIRQFNSAGLMKGIGVFTIVNGGRSVFEHALLDADDQPVTGHEWNGGYVISILTDPDGKEKVVRPPNTAGNG